MNRWVQLADRVDTGCLDGHLHLRCHGSRTHANHMDALGAVFLVGTTGEREDSRLGRAVVAPTFKCAGCGTGTDIDDDARALRFHMRDCCAQAVVDALEIDVDNASPFRRVGIRQA